MGQQREGGGLGGGKVHKGQSELTWKGVAGGAGEGGEGGVEVGSLIQPPFSCTKR